MREILGNQTLYRRIVNTVGICRRTNPKTNYRIENVPGCIRPLDEAHISLRYYRYVQLQKLSDLSRRGRQIIEVFKIPQALKSAGPEGMHPAICRQFAEFHAASVTQLYNASFGKGVLLEKCKTAMVMRIFDERLRHKPDVYRPMCLTCFLSGCKEGVV